MSDCKAIDEAPDDSKWIFVKEIDEQKIYRNSATGKLIAISFTPKALAHLAAVTGDGTLH